VPALSARHLCRQWNDRLSAYRRHRNDEHLEALVDEAHRYCGLHLENDLSRSSFWEKAPLSRRAAVLLYLVDKGVVDRRSVKGRRLYEPTDSAEAWVAAQPALAPYAAPTLELIAALRREVLRRTRPSRS
jgi:hypothetical protein